MINLYQKHNKDLPAKSIIFILNKFYLSSNDDKKYSQLI